VLVEEAIQAGLKLPEIWVEAERASPAELATVALAEAGGALKSCVRPGTLARIKTSVTPPPILALAEIPAEADSLGQAESHSPRQALLGDVALVAVDMADPSNAGALLRCAEGAGVREVVFAGNCVDSWSPKTVRASAGSVFRVRPRRVADAAEHLRLEKESGRQVIATASQQGQPYYEVDFSLPSTVVLGNETHGIAESLEQFITTWVHIPLAGSVESLNVSTAAAVICFEARRQNSSSQVVPDGVAEVASDGVAEVASDGVAEVAPNGVAEPA